MQQVSRWEPGSVPIMGAACDTAPGSTQKQLDSQQNPPSEVDNPKPQGTPMQEKVFLKYIHVIYHTMSFYDKQKRHMRVHTHMHTHIYTFSHSLSHNHTHSHIIKLTHSHSHSHIYI